MNTRTALVTLVWLAVVALLASQMASAAKRIGEWQPSTQPPEEQVQPAEGAQGSGEETAVEETLPAQILAAAAAAEGVVLKGSLISRSAESLQPSAEAPDTPLERLPVFVSKEPFGDYALVAIGAGEFEHPKGQTLRVAFFELGSSGDAWGLWSIGRGETRVLAGQAASYGRELRAWQGRFAAVISLDPPDPRLDEIRLSQFARALCARIPGRGSPPEMEGWLPTANLLPHTAQYFHANAPLGGEALQLSPETEGITATYRLGAQFLQGVLVRYPTPADAMAGWNGFVGQYLGQDTGSGTPGSRRVVARGGTWSGVKVKGTVCAFVVGAPTRNQAEIWLTQALARAHD